MGRDLSVRAASERPPVLSPLRRGWLDPNPVAIRGRASDDVAAPARAQWGGPLGTEDVRVSVVSGRPFADESSTVDTFVSLCESLTGESARVCLVSAHGVGDSIEDANAGIQIMRDWYLRSAPRRARARRRRSICARPSGATRSSYVRACSHSGPCRLDPVERPRARSRASCRWIAHGSNTTRATI